MPTKRQNLRPRVAGKRNQRGVATLTITLILLGILTIIVLASSNTGLFEQKTATNENRAHLSQQAAEYALALGGEFLKANVVNVASNEDSDGWLSSGANLHWRTCAGVTDTNHPCFAAPASIRSQLYYYTADGTVVTDSTSAKLNLPISIPTSATVPSTMMPTAAYLKNVGSTAQFPVTTTVRALLCRLDTTAGSTASCQTNPTTGNRIAITLIASSGMAGESSAASVKETWGTYNSFNVTSAVPLSAAGLVKGLGDGSIVSSPNAGGYGVAGSVWSPQNVDVDGSGGGGIGSFTTCHLGDFLGDVPVANLETSSPGCAGTGNTGCSCSNVAKGSPDMLSGHYGGSYEQEGPDILDVDGDHGSAYQSTTGNLETITQPDIQFFPGKNAAGTCMDDATNATDDNLFEWIFNTDVNGSNVCSAPEDFSKEDGYLAGVGGTLISNSCSSLDTSSSGLYYSANTDNGSTCNLGNVGTPDNPVIVVVNGPVKLNGGNFFGMLFIRYTGTGTAPDPLLSIAGNGNLFGSIVVNGNVNGHGTFNIIYVDTSTGTPGKKLPASSRFARVPGSWLDNSAGF